MIITRLSGGMGNQMFQYALGRVLSIKNKTTLGLDLHDLLDRTPRHTGFTFRNYDLDLFNIQASILSSKEIPWKYRSFGTGTVALLLGKVRRRLLHNKGKEHHVEVNTSILSLGPNTYLDGYWQSHKYFIGYEDVIRKDFSITASLSNEIQILKKEIQEQSSVCIHIRRGDYVGNAFHEVVKNDYYHTALEILLKKIKVEHLYVFSDDIAWCRDNLTFDQPTTFVGDEYAGERAIGHFALMRACSHFIIPNSSFAWWAAWLGESSEKIVIAPKQWFGDASIETNDRVPLEWIRI